jgi:hypothetical protein
MSLRELAIEMDMLRRAESFRWRYMDRNRTILVASHNGRDTDKATEALNRYLLEGKGVGRDGCFRGFSFVFGRLMPSDNLTICDVGNGVGIPEALRRPDMIATVYGGEDKVGTANPRGFFATSEPNSR